MFYSKTTTYAINALVWLAQHSSDEHLGVRQIADHLEIPPHFLGKIMQNLRQSRLVQSTRGRNGGYQLAVSPGEIALMDVVATVEEPRKYETCLFGMEQCRPDLSCATICEWNEILGSITHFLHKYSIADLLRIQTHRS